MGRHGVSALFVVVAAIVLVLVAGTAVQFIFSGGSSSVANDLLSSSNDTQDQANDAQDALEDRGEEMRENFSLPVDEGSD